MRENKNIGGIPILFTTLLVCTGCQKTIVPKTQLSTLRTRQKSQRFFSEYVWPSKPSQFPRDIKDKFCLEIFNSVISQVLRSKYDISSLMNTTNKYQQNALHILSLKESPSLILASLQFLFKKREKPLVFDINQQNLMGLTMMDLLLGRLDDLNKALDRLEHIIMEDLKVQKQLTMILSKVDRKICQEILDNSSPLEDPDDLKEKCKGFLKQENINPTNKEFFNEKGINNVIQNERIARALIAPKQYWNPMPGYIFKRNAIQCSKENNLDFLRQAQIRYTQQQTDAQLLIEALEILALSNGTTNQKRGNILTSNKTYTNETKEILKNIQELKEWELIL